MCSDLRQSETCSIEPIDRDLGGNQEDRWWGWRWGTCLLQLMKIILLAKAIKCYLLGTAFLNKQGIPLGELAAGELKQSTVPNYSGLPSSLPFQFCFPKIKARFNYRTLCSAKHSVSHRLFSQMYMCTGKCNLRIIFWLIKNVYAF